MFIILVYDVNEKRVAKVLKTCRKYLSWVQNSVFEGEISKASFTKLIRELEAIIDRETDLVIYYTFRSLTYSKREILGVEKGGQQQFL